MALRTCKLRLKLDIESFPVKPCHAMSHLRIASSNVEHNWVLMSFPSTTRYDKKGVWRVDITKQK